jgi:bifunctional UDP-N-acetylglucosamine pyrophosphorylase / glucosamine-1-phosphate N-acetyltransferase
MNTRIVILAGGKGKRMRSELPKVLTPLNGRPIMAHLLAAVAAAGIDPRPTIVVGYGADEVKRVFGPNYSYVLQERQLGTGHAVQQTETMLKDAADAIMVLYGDQPFIKPSTIAELHARHAREGRVLTMMTILADDFDAWRAPLFDFGRIVRDADGRIARIVEKKDAVPEELAIRELNPSFFCFNAAWLWNSLKKLTNHNAQDEYYLTDLVQLAISEGETIASMNVSAREGIGVNTPEHLELAKEISYQ